MAKDKYIICIDDEVSALHTITLICETLGHKTIAFENPLEAIDYIKDNTDKISLIFLDLMMPQMYGLNVLELLQKNDDTKLLPVVINSCLMDPKEIERSYKLGAKEFVNKPFTKQDISEIVKQHTFEK